jgi:prophage DNA circulation protein
MSIGLGIDIADIFRVLIPASFKGVDFWMIDSRITVGRRVQKFLFPGRDDAVWEDLGAVDGPIPITGILVGDDYVSQAKDMAQAFRSAGPGQLLHPWLGELRVILPHPGTISFSQHSLRRASLEFTVELFDPTKPAPTDTLGSLLDAIEDIQAQATGLINAVLAPINLTVAAIGAVQAVCGAVAGIIGQVVGAVGYVFSAVSGEVAALAGVGGLPPGPGYPAAVGAVLEAPFDAIAQTSATLLPAAIGPGDAAPSATPQDARATAAMLLAATGGVAALGSATAIAAPTGAMALAGAAYAVGAAVDAATDIVFTSQQDARFWLAQIQAGVDQVAALAVSLGPVLPVTAGQVYRSCQALRAAVAADINAQIGRLPIVQTLTMASTMPAWLVAQALAGDNPAQLLATYQDLVARNAVAYPLAMGPGSIEALVAA